MGLCFEDLDKKDSKQAIDSLSEENLRLYAKHLHRRARIAEKELKDAVSKSRRLESALIVARKACQRLKQQD